PENIPRHGMVQRPAQSGLKQVIKPKQTLVAQRIGARYPAHRAVHAMPNVIRRSRSTHHGIGSHHVRPQAVAIQGIGFFPLAFGKDLALFVTGWASGRGGGVEALPPHGRQLLRQVTETSQGAPQAVRPGPGKGWVA
nr:hypothetical protein [Tanacetum cinerariifolium]